MHMRRATGPPPNRWCLTRVTDQEGTPNVLADFRYDGQGRFSEKVAEGTTTRYYHDGDRIVKKMGGGEVSGKG